MVKKYQVLASGIDSLSVSVDVQWKNESFFEYLTQIKANAKVNNEDQSIKFHSTDEIALLKPYGRKGYEWVIENENFTLTMGNWVKPISRPSIMVSISSIALWNIGAQEMIHLICSLIENSGGEVLSVKPSRIDLCVDIVLPSSIWDIDLIPLRVTRAAYAAPHFSNTKLQGISLGKGNIAGRLYDKPLEIKQKSKKFWVYDIWGIGFDIPNDVLIIRVEGQFRREIIKEVGLDNLEETFSHIEKLWGYFTQDWLKFQDNPGSHHTMRKTLGWWEVVQNSFMGIQDPTPLIRCKSHNQRKRQLYAQTSGTLTSILALDHEDKNKPLNSSANLGDLQEQLKSCHKKFGKSDFQLEIDLFTKRTKFHKAKAKMAKVHKKRIDQGLPSNIDPGLCSEEHYD